MKVLIKCFGFIGDILFASSIAERLHAEAGTEPLQVDYLLPLPQPILLLKQNPFIGHIYMPNDVNGTEYDRVVELGPVNQSIPATGQFQAAAGVQNVMVPYHVYTVPAYDRAAEMSVQALRDAAPGKPIVAVQANWAEKTYRYTQEQYEMGIGTHRIITPDRDIALILRKLEDYCTLVEVGLDRGISQFSHEACNPELYAYTASILKQCDWMIGAEGGLTNLSAGVGTRTIITTDFLWRQYGPDGHMMQCDEPQMGPCTYFPNGGHYHLNPYLTDAQVADAIRLAVQNPDQYL